MKTQTAIRTASPFLHNPVQTGQPLQSGGVFFMEKQETNQVRLHHRTTHGLSKTRIYHTWKLVKSRCLNPNIPAFKKYGALGIKICDEWKNNPVSFINWGMTHGYADDLSIHRVN